jgi:hypothetical protein
MSVTTVATLRSALGVGTLYTDAVLQSVCDAADQVMLPFLFTNETYNVAHSNTTTEGTLYFEQRVTDIFYVGESVVITKNGTPFNGTKTITAVDVQSISFAVTGNPTEQGYHPVVPLGVVSGTTQADYTTVDAVKQASLQICEAIWQARQAPSGQGLTVDGYQVSPFTMSNTLLARVRGLLSPYLDPRSMVG